MFLTLNHFPSFFSSCLLRCLPDKVLTATFLGPQRPENSNPDPNTQRISAERYPQQCNVVLYLSLNALISRLMYCFLMHAA